MATQAPAIPRKPRIGRVGVLEWIMTVDHKRIGILYIASAFVFFLIGGAEALLMRIQLARPLAGLQLGIESLRKGAIQDPNLSDDLLVNMEKSIDRLRSDR